MTTTVARFQYIELIEEYSPTDYDQASRFAQQFTNLIPTASIRPVAQRGRPSDRMTNFAISDQQRLAIYGPRRDLFCLALLRHTDLRLPQIRLIVQDVLSQPYAFLYTIEVENGIAIVRADQRTIYQGSGLEVSLVNRILEAESFYRQHLDYHLIENREAPLAPPMVPVRPKLRILV